MLHNFVYDGNGKDTFFWAGSSNRPSSKGFIVPDKDGRTNVLGRCVLTLTQTVINLGYCAGISMRTSYSNCQVSRRSEISSGFQSSISHLKTISVMFTSEKALSPLVTKL